MTTWLISYQGERFERVHGESWLSPPRAFISNETTNLHPVDWLAKKHADFSAVWRLMPETNCIVIAERVLGILSAIEYPEKPT